MKTDHQGVLGLALPPRNITYIAAHTNVTHSLCMCNTVDSYFRRYIRHIKYRYSDIHHHRQKYTIFLWMVLRTVWIYRIVLKMGCILALFFSCFSLLVLRLTKWKCTHSSNVNSENIFDRCLSTFWRFDFRPEIQFHRCALYTRCKYTRA